MNKRGTNDPFADINEQLRVTPGQAQEGGPDGLRQLEEAFIVRISSTQDGSFRNIRQIKTLPSAFVARVMAAYWPRWSEEQHLILTNMIAEEVSKSDYLPCALTIASAVAVVDGRSGIRMLARLEGKLLSGKKNLERYHGQVRQCFLEDRAASFYSISQIQDGAKGDILSAGRQLFHACFLLAQDLKLGVQPEVQHDVLLWLISSDILLPLVGEHDGPIQDAVKGWPLAMVSKVLALRDKMKGRKPGSDFLDHILPSLESANTSPTDKVSPAETAVRTDTTHRTPEEMLEGLAAHLRRIREDNNSLETELAAARDELRQLTDNNSIMDAERRKFEERFADTDRKFRDFRKDMEKHNAKLRKRNAECLSAKAKAESEAASLKEKLAIGARRSRELEGRLQELGDRHREEIAQVSGRVDAESKHAAEELKRAIVADLDGDFKELQHLGDSEENRIASIMVERIFRKLARNGIKFEKVS